MADLMLIDFDCKFVKVIEGLNIWDFVQDSINSNFDH